MMESPFRLLSHEIQIITFADAIYDKFKEFVDLHFFRNLVDTTLVFLIAWTQPTLTVENIMSTGSFSDSLTN